MESSYRASSEQDNYKSSGKSYFSDLQKLGYNSRSVVKGLTLAGLLAVSPMFISGCASVPYNSSGSVPVRSYYIPAPKPVPLKHYHPPVFRPSPSRQIYHPPVRRPSPPVRLYHPPVRRPSPPRQIHRPSAFPSPRQIRRPSAFRSSPPRQMRHSPTPRSRPRPRR